MGDNSKLTEQAMILITGATGNNGGELIRQLTAMGQRVRALVRNPAKAANLQGPNIELAAGDFDQPETLNAALQGVEKAFLLTPVAERFVQWQRAFIEAAQRAKVKHLVKFSGSCPYGEPTTPQCAMESPGRAPLES
jgi:uncharacterized protein YbjT (DUF2867 family)